MTRRYATYPEQKQIDALIGEYSHEIGGELQYKRGVSDGTIAKLVGAEGLTANHVRKVRRQCYPALVTSRLSGENSAALAARVAAVERAINEILAWAKDHEPSLFSAVILSWNKPVTPSKPRSVLPE